MQHKIKWIACAVFALCSTTGRAQGRALPFLMLNPDARAQSLGNTAVGLSQGMYLYTNPSGIFYTDKKASVDASLSFFPKEEGATGHLGIYTATGHWRPAKSHAVMLGFRYAGGLTFPGYDLFGQPTKDYKPFDWALDLGYAYRFTPELSVFASGSFFYSHLSSNARGGAFGLGATYHKRDVRLGNHSAAYTLTAKVSDFGPKLDYGNTEADLPASASLGGEFSMALSEQHAIAASLGARYYFLPKDSHLFTSGIGVEYTYDKKYSLRAGYELAEHNMSHATFGAGIKYGGLKFNAAYALKTSDNGVNHFTLGLGFDF